MRLIFILLLGITLASCSIATGFVVLAEEPPVLQIPEKRAYGTVFWVQKTMMCNDTPVVSEYVYTNFGQVATDFGLLLKDPMGNYGMLTAIYVNPQSKTFSIVEQAAQGVSCIVSSGEMWTTQYEDPKF
jgi:hypothetical protein|tara:strand:+ start:4883 stop:5269 length:387 start_codon:yes stop_codon:yes gene_type:complete